LNCSDETASKIDAKVLEIIKEAHQKAREILEENKEKLHELAAFLLERETITGEEFMRLLNSEADVIETSATVVKEGEADAEEASSI
jgi:cell division protease FtsH